MARIITPAKPEPRAARWTEAGDEVVVIALDRNELVAIVNATREYRRRVDSGNFDPTPLNAAGARVHEALAPIKRDNGWS